MATNPDLVPASCRLLYLLAILTCPDVASQNRLLLLNVAHFPRTVRCWGAIPVPRLTATSTTAACFARLLCLRMWPLETVAIVLRAICWYSVCLAFLASRLLLSWLHAHELRCRRLLNSRFNQFFILSLINTTYSCGSCVRFCACSAALIVDGGCGICSSLLLALQQLLHKLIVLIDREWFVLAMGTLHRLLMVRVLNEGLRVIVIWSTGLDQVLCH